MFTMLQKDLCINEFKAPTPPLPQLHSNTIPNHCIYGQMLCQRTYFFHKMVRNKRHGALAFSTLVALFTCKHYTIMMLTSTDNSKMLMGCLKWVQEMTKLQIDQRIIRFHSTHPKAASIILNEVEVYSTYQLLVIINYFCLPKKTETKKQE